MNQMHTITVQKHPTSDGQHRLSQEDIKRIVEQHDQDRDNDGKHNKKKIGTKCEQTGCDRYWLFCTGAEGDENEAPANAGVANASANAGVANVCQQCMAPVQCMGCGRFLCMECRTIAKLRYGLNDVCNQHSKNCIDCKVND